MPGGWAAGSPVNGAHCYLSAILDARTKPVCLTRAQSLAAELVPETLGKPAKCHGIRKKHRKQVKKDAALRPYERMYL